MSYVHELCAVRITIISVLQAAEAEEAIREAERKKKEQEEARKKAAEVERQAVVFSDHRAGVELLSLCS